MTSACAPSRATPWPDRRDGWLSLSRRPLADLCPLPVARIPDGRHHLAQPVPGVGQAAIDIDRRLASAVAAENPNQRLVMAAVLRSAPHRDVAASRRAVGVWLCRAARGFVRHGPPPLSQGPVNETSPPFSTLLGGAGLLPGAPCAGGAVAVTTSREASRRPLLTWSQDIRRGVGIVRS